MNTKSTIATFMLLTSCISLSAEKRAILKLDDLRQIPRYEDAFAKTYDLIKKENIKASFGIIPADQENLKPEYKVMVEKFLGDKDIEVWQHGYTHKKNGDNGEYRGTSYEEQLNALTLAQEAMKKNFKHTPLTFGPPYNHTDETTHKALLAQGELQAVFFMKDRKDGLKYLNNRVDMENGTGKVNFEFFKQNLQNAKGGPDLIVLQGHPDKWYDENNYHKEFTKIVNYLKAEGYTFVLPKDVK